MLLVGLGRATRLLRYLAGLPKTYEGEIVLGVETDTLDAGGVVVARHDMVATGADVRAAASRFVGAIEQVPPMVSAVKVGGRRLYEMARAGENVNRVARPVTVWRFDVEETPDPAVYRIRVECSSGTYIRSLAADVGTELGGGAHLRALRRLAVGSFSSEEACPLDSLGPERVLAPAVALRDYPSAVVSDEVAVTVSHGGLLDGSALAPGDQPGGSGPVAVLDRQGQLLAVYELRSDAHWKPSVVMVAS